MPEMQVAVIPRDEIIFKDGWHVQGLKATGSYDYSAEDVFVPQPAPSAVLAHAAPG